MEVWCGDGGVIKPWLKVLKYKILNILIMTVILFALVCNQNSSLFHVWWGV